MASAEKGPADSPPIYSGNQRGPAPKDAQYALWWILLASATTELAWRTISETGCADELEVIVEGSPQWSARAHPAIDEVVGAERPAPTI